MLNSLIGILFCIMIVVKCTHIAGDYKIGVFDENGTHYIGKNIDQRLWIRFNTLIKPTQSFWLKIKRKKPNDYPVVLKSSGRNSSNFKTALQSIDCHFVAISHLMTHQSADKQNQDKIPLVNETVHIHDVTEYSPISLCEGISGIVSHPDGKNLIRIVSFNDGAVRLARLTQIPKLSMDKIDDVQDYNQFTEAAVNAVHRSKILQRVKRSFHMPVHNRPGPFLVELFLIVDSKMAFMQFNIYFAVVQLEIWVEDQVKLNDENHILTELQLYKRRYITKKHDCVHAILGENQNSAKRGESEPGSMCAFNKCVGYTKDNFDLGELEIAHTIMHELGHNFGLTHDTERCQCSGCIMATGVEFGSRKFQWSNCTRRQIVGLLKSGMADCLTDGEHPGLGDFKPIILSSNNVVRVATKVVIRQCGNGVVDDGEQCDCGGRDFCSAEEKRCCNPDNCRLRVGALCAGGACCDLNRCSIKSAGTVCRYDANNDCDLPEYCDGDSEWCPVDSYKANGVSCRTVLPRDKSHCYKGECNSRRSWCRVLYGDTAEDAYPGCYDMNMIGNEIKNCGVEVPKLEERTNRPKYWVTRQCKTDNTMCGRLWCSHENEKVLRLSPLMSHDEEVRGYQCSGVRFFLDWFMDDAGMVPNGAPCDYGKMCWRGYCINNIYNDMGGCYCHGHGVCNNQEHCHCDPGFAPANCTRPGNGGSIDSGPPPQFNRLSRIMIAGCLITVVVLITIFLVAFLLYHYNTHRWPYLFAKIKLPNYKILSGSFMGTSVTSNHVRKRCQRKNRSSAILLSELQVDADVMTEDKSDVILTECLKRIHSNSDHLSLDELNAVLDNVFLKKPSPIIESDESVKPEFKISKFTRPPVPKFSLNREYKYHTKETNDTPLCSPITSPTPESFPDEIIYANIPSHNSKNASDRSPPIKKNPVKPSSVKAKATMFETMSVNKPHTTVSMPIKPSSITNSRPPLTTSIDMKDNSKPTQHTLSSAKDNIAQKPITNHSIEKPSLINSNGSDRPNIRNKPTATTTNSDTSTFTRRTLTAKNQLSPPSKCKEATSNNIKVTISSGKVTTRDKISTLTKTKEASPNKNNTSIESRKLPAKGEISTLTKNTDASQNNDKTSIVSRKLTTKDQISQPRLNSTTCTASTRALPVTDQTLSRTVVPHKVIKVDADKAVKYLC